MSKTFKVGDFILRERPGFREKLAALRARKRNHQKPGIEFKVCENPDTDWGRCRALTADGTRCTRSRTPFNLFCGTHHGRLRKIVGAMSVNPKNSGNKVHDLLRIIGCRGKLKMYVTYYFDFGPCRFRIVTPRREKTAVPLSTWLKEAMRAEEIAYWPHVCHKCKQSFISADAGGAICSLCWRPVCKKCWDQHSRHHTNKSIARSLRVPERTSDAEIAFYAADPGGAIPWRKT